MPPHHRENFKDSRFAARLRTAASIGLIVLQAGFSQFLQAGDVGATVTDPGGNPVPDAVLSLHSEKTTKAPAGMQAVMDQHSTQFDPHVLVVRPNTSVRFPNSDDIHHEVYSFSKAKTFELPLYHGSTVAPVIFENPGLIVLGCNIHDNMLGYIYVVDSPWFAKTDAAGRSTISGVPPGRYTARLWYPGLTETAALAEKSVDVPASGAASVSFDNAQRETRAASPTKTRSWNERRANP
jgi:plastocyanin